MYFVALTWRNVSTRKVRSLLTGTAVAISISTVVTMGVLTHSLRRTAISILRTGTADFSIAQRGVSDVTYSSIDQSELQEIRVVPGVRSTVGVLVEPFKLDNDHPFFLRIGIQPESFNDFGVEVVVGRPYASDAEDEAMLGYRAARELKKTVGDKVVLDTIEYTVVGIFQTGQVFGDSASMLPLPALQGRARKPGVLTLIFVRVQDGANMDAVRATIEKEHPQLATVRTESEFGKVDRNLELISAANLGVSALALVVGAVSILNTMVLTVFERTREFGVLRAIGWSRIRVLAEVMTEAMMVTFTGAGFGVLGGFVAVYFLQRSPALQGVFDPDYPASVFGRALAIAFGMAVVGALYPAARAALLVPLTAIRHE